MDDPLSQLAPGRTVTVHLIGGQVVRGQVASLRGGWLHVANEPSGALINLMQAATIALDSHVAPSSVTDAPRPRPESKDRPQRAAGTALGRAWLDEDLRAVADAFLDGSQDGAIAERTHRSRGQISALRQAFECARGNLVEEQISPIAATWVARWRKVLAG